MAVLRACTLAGSLVVGLVAAGPPRVAVAQDLALADRAPRFFQASGAGDGGGLVEVDAGSYALLRRVVSLTIDRATVGRLLEEVERQTGLRFFYDEAVVSPERPVTLRADSITVATALTGILMDAGVDALFSRSGHVALVKKRPVRAAAATGSVAGRVTDAKTGDGLVGAEVWLEGTRQRTAAGENGYYRLAEVEVGSYTLAVRRIGYGKRSRSVVVAAEEEVTVDVALEPVPTSLNDVVVTATGEQRLLELGHVVGRINADSLAREAPIMTVTELLAARVPGLQISQGQGTVGGDVRIQIRGANSLALSTEPIVVVDGVRYSTARTSSGTAPWFEHEPSNRLNDLNPNDIESIEVVKGPSAATLYGTDASNGVLVITTKRGHAGAARWRVFGRATTMNVPTARFADSYWAWGSAAESCTLVRVAAGACTQDSITVVPNPLNNSTTSMFGSEGSWNGGLDVSGGRDDLKYYFSANVDESTGPIRFPPALVERARAQMANGTLPASQLTPNTNQRTNLRANVEVGLGRTGALRVTSGYTRGATRTLAVSHTHYLQAFGVRDPTDSASGIARPELLFYSRSTEDLDRFTLSASGDVRPAGWLMLRASAGIDLESTARYSLAPRIQFDGGFVGDDRLRSTTTTVDLGATASARAGRLSFRTTLGAQYLRVRGDGTSAWGIELLPGGESIQEAPVTSTSQRFTGTVTAGTYLEEVVGLNDRLFLTGALRADGASSFGRDYDAAIYPKAGASWLISEEPFVPRIPALDEVRLRYAFGASGQQPLATMARPFMRTYQTNLNGRPVIGLETYVLGNPDLRPERVREHEFGFDAAFFNGRVRMETAWFQRRTVDALRRVLQPSGLDQVWVNIGELRDKGFEAQLSLQVLDTRMLSWDVSLRHATTDARLVKLGGGTERYGPGGGFVEGSPIGARFMFPLAGFEDANGNGIIEDHEIQMGPKPVYVGRSDPPQNQTLTTAIGLFDRKVRISALFNREAGATQYNVVKERQCARSCLALVDPATPLAEQARVRALGRGAAEPYVSAGYAFIESANFIRLQELSVSLDLPARFLRVLRLRQGTVTFTGRNLGLWTSFGGPDPESSGGVVRGSVPAAGDEDVAGGIPQSRVWSARVDLSY